MAPCDLIRIPQASNKDPSQGLTVADYIKLWQYFEERGAKDKDRMITLVTWLLAFAVAIIAIAGKEYVQFKPGPCIKEPSAIFLFSGVGILICGLAIYLVLEFARYARINFIKADYSMARISDLDRVFIGKDVKLREGGRWLSTNDLGEDHSIKEVGRRATLSRVGPIFRTLIRISAAFGLALGVLAGLAAATALGTIDTCPP